MFAERRGVILYTAYFFLIYVVYFKKNILTVS